MTTESLLLIAAGGWALFLAIGCRDHLVANRWNAGIVALLLGGLTVWHVARLTDASDRFNYVVHLRFQASRDTPWEASFVDDPLYELFAWIVAKATDANDHVLYGLVTAVAVASYYTAGRLLMPAWASALALLTILSTGFLIAYASVGIRQGLATSLLVLAASAFAAQRGGRPLVIGLVVAAALFHWSAIPFAGALSVMLYWRPSIRVLAGGWAVLAVLFATGLNRALLSGVTSEVDKYTSAAAFARYSSTGLRFDFLAFSALLLGAAILGRRWIESGGTREVFDRLLAAYLAFNAFFLLFGFVAFSDRIAAYSWFLAPLMMWLVLSQRRRVNSAQVTLTTLLVLSGGVVTGGLTAIA